jgi:hypothetical protein
LLLPPLRTDCSKRGFPDKAGRSTTRDRRGLLECPAGIPGEAFEAAIDAGVITAQGTEDKTRRAELVTLVFCAWSEKVSRRDAR